MVRAMQYNVIDADGHILEPPDLWEKYIDPKYRDICPRLFVLENGGEMMRIEGNEGLDIGRGKKPVTFGVTGAFGARDGSVPTRIPYLSGKKGGFDPHARIPDMDAEGIDAAFLYPSLALFLGAIKDPDYASATCRAYNRWLADYCAPYKDRLFGSWAVNSNPARRWVRWYRRCSICACWVTSMRARRKGRIRQRAAVRDRNPRDISYSRPCSPAYATT
jgi:predicted TIM-barrel fold metal-dependent hydrolase